MDRRDKILSMPAIPLRTISFLLLTMTLSLQAEELTLGENEGKRLNLQNYSAASSGPVSPDSPKEGAYGTEGSFIIRNNTDEPSWYLVFEEQWDSAVMDIRILPQATRRRFFSGDTVPMNERPLRHYLLTFPLNIPPGGRAEIGLNVHDGQNKTPAFQLLSAPDFIFKGTATESWIILCLSLMILASYSSLPTFYSSREAIHLIYLIFGLCLTVSIAGQNRILSVYITPNRPYGYFAFLFFNSLATIAGIRFIKKAFSLNRKNWIHRMFLMLQYPLAGFVLAACIWPNPVLSLPMNICITAAALGSLAISLSVSLSGGKFSQKVLLSFTPIAAGVLLELFLIYTPVQLPWPSNIVMLTAATLHVLLMQTFLSVKQKEIAREMKNLRQKYIHVVKRSRELEHGASRDPLSGLYNRKSLSERIEIFEKQGPFDQILGFAFIDLDNFKYYNDTFGHAEGDRILRRTAAYLTDNIRQSDLLFRYGGDEFLIMMPDTDSRTIRSLSDRLHKGFREMVEDMKAVYPLGSPKLSLSIGVYEYRYSEDENLHQALHKADLALLRAKEMGKDRVLHFQ